MSITVVELIKHNKIILRLYKIVGKAFIYILRLFVKSDPKLILFNCFGGKKFDDSTKAIYLKMKNDTRFNDYNLVWAFHDPSLHPEIPLRIKTDNLQYFIYALKARCWITNSAIQRGIVFKGDNTYAINTWHGTPLKYMGDKNNPNKKNDLIDTYDTILAQGEYDITVLSDNWNISPNKFCVFGLPRNDVLIKATDIDKNRIRNKLGIPQDNLVVLYAPTFRDYVLDDDHTCSLEVPFDYDYWENLFGTNMTFIFRMHYEVRKHNSIPKRSMWKDFSYYDDLSELMIASDVLITDYSSIMFDFSILGKPIINYLYDYEEYSTKRGLLFDIRKELSWFKDNKELADYLYIFDYEKEKEKAIEFRSKYVNEYGSATEKTIDLIYDKLTNC